MKVEGVLLTTLIVLSWHPAKAGKVESIQEVVKKECSQKVTYDEALSLIRVLYLSCIPGTYVFVNPKCKVRCMKSDAGAVIGR